MTVVPFSDSGRGVEGVSVPRRAWHGLGDRGCGDDGPARGRFKSEIGPLRRILPLPVALLFVSKKAMTCHDSDARGFRGFFFATPQLTWLRK
jgi:hypothetical protein